MTGAEPSQATHPDPALELDAFVAAFEAAAAAGTNPDLELFLPQPAHPLRDAVLRELVRVDLEFAWAGGRGRRVEEYRDRFPQLFEDSTAIRDLLREEFRLRKAAGETPNPREYRDRFGVEPESGDPESRPTNRLHPSTPAWPAERMPEVGDTIPPGYRLIGELGRGAFGRVFLAREIDLGERPVAIKLSAQFAGESITLARLQHTNIVPIYAAHRLGRFTSIVMPFVGRTTLGDLLASFRAGQVPQSGHGVVSTLADRAKSTAGTIEDFPDSKPTPAPGRSRAVLEALDRMTFAEAILWIGTELADGLAHAHERGILHRDIKPANVLFTDEGRPMFLDFNLASVGEGRVAGTPAYMAPEQLAAAVENRGLATPQTDVYALGLVLVELFAGRLPFAEPRGPWEEMLPHMIAERKRPPLDGLPLPPDVTPGVRAILRKCLEPDPAHRYATAAELREDLNRQRTHQPLQFAREGSLRERARKWAHRHPRLSSGGTIAAAALLVLGVLTAAYLGNHWRLELRDAELAHAGLRDAREFTQSGASLSPPGEWRAVHIATLSALAPYRVESDDWVNGPLVTRRPERERAELRRDAAQLMFRAAEATAAIAREEPAARANLLAEALEWNRRARAAFPGRPTRPQLRQQAALLRASGKTDEATAVEELVKETAVPDPDDLMGLGFAALDAHDYAGAAEKLREAARGGPPRYSVWMGLAAAEQRCGRFAIAIEALSAASALRPASAWPFFHRGVARMELKDYAAAAADFDRFLELEPADPVGYLNRAIVRLMMKDHRGALADCDRAEQNHCTATRLYSVREQARQGLGDKAGAGRDLQTFLTTKPTDRLSWCARGERKLALEPRDAAGALKDFDEALALDPALLNALRDKASVLADDPRHYAEAVKVLDRVLELAPASPADRAGKAVVLARLGRSAEALREVEACATQDGDPLVLYQLASAALLANDKPGGLKLLRSALRKDPSFAAQMPHDADLQTVWKDPVFVNLIAAANTLNQQ